MLSQINLIYSKESKNNVKFLLDDAVNQKLLKISVYCVKDNWYIDISDNEKALLIGKIINSWVDIFEVLKIYDKDFPNMKLMPLPSNINGINKEFEKDLPGILQELFLVKDEE